jgi:hypothetical protein
VSLKNLRRKIGRTDRHGDEDPVCGGEMNDELEILQLATWEDTDEAPIHLGRPEGPANEK